MISGCEYPTRNGIAIPPCELELPYSNLRLDKPRNLNLHHHEFTARTFGKFVLLDTLRNLECNQTYMPIDQHAWLHQEYDPPKPPTSYQAMREIERAKDEGEKLRYKSSGHYAMHEITDLVLSKCISSYNQMKTLYL